MILAQKKFRIGDTVRLNSGSPDLKVVASGPKKTTVEWHDGESVKRYKSPTVCFKSA
jgi:uncharacterized protein YodC (DUF2158 family)